MKRFMAVVSLLVEWNEVLTDYLVGALSWLVAAAAAFTIAAPAHAALGDGHHLDRRDDPVWSRRVLLASRNSSGTMSGISGPYISGTPISSSIINARFADIENELTDSLSRSGKGSMTAAMKEADGTVAAPSYSFGNDTGSGFYRIGANNIGWAINGVKRLDCSTTGCIVTGTLNVTSDFSVATNKFNVTAASGNTAVAGSLASNGVTGTPIGLTTHGGSTPTLTNVQRLVTSNAIAIETTYTADNYLPGLAWYTADENPTKPKAAIWARSTATGSHLMLGTSNAYATGVTNTAIDIDQAGAVAIAGTLGVTGASTLTGGVTIGSSGTAIGASYSASSTLSLAAVNGSSCSTYGANTITVTGAVPGDQCIIGIDKAAQAAWTSSLEHPTCQVTTANNAVIQICNPTIGAITPTANTTYTARVFH